MNPNSGNFSYSARLPLRFTALLTAFFFSWSCFNFPASAAPASQASAGVEVLKTPASKLRIPEELGRLEESTSLEKMPRVIIIQDAHSIPEAQKNICELIEYFEKAYGIRKVAVEGSASSFDASMLRSFPDQALLKKELEYYASRGELTGPVAASILSKTSADYEGLEDWSLYEDGIGLYQKALDSATDLGPARADLKKRKQAVYSKSLFELDQALENFQDHKKDLIDVLKIFAQYKQPDQTSLKVVFAELNKDQKEEEALRAEIRKVTGSLKPSKELNEKLQDYKTSQIGAAEFALWLEEKSGIPFPQQFAGILKQHKKLSEMQGPQFFRDFEAYVSAVKESLFRNAGERALDKESRQLYLAEKLAKLELTRAEWAELKPSAKKSETYSFYENAEKRDTVFAKKLGAYGDPVVFVGGGFHSEGLTQRLKAQGVSYALVMPKISAVPEKSNYQEQMRGEVSWKDYFRVENGKVNLYEAFLRATRDKLLKENPALLKAWRDAIIRDLAAAGKIERAGDYTKYLDEALPQQTPSWMPKVEKFIDGLRKLEASNQLTDKNILALVKPATAVPFAPAGAVARSEIRAELVNLAPSRSESRTDRRNHIYERQTNQGFLNTVFASLVDYLQLDALDQRILGTGVVKELTVKTLPERDLQDLYTGFGMNRWVENVWGEQSLARSFDFYLHPRDVEPVIPVKKDQEFPSTFDIWGTGESSKTPLAVTMISNEREKRASIFGSDWKNITEQLRFLTVLNRLTEKGRKEDYQKYLHGIDISYFNAIRKVREIYKRENGGGTNDQIVIGAKSGLTFDLFRKRFQEALGQSPEGADAVILRLQKAINAFIDINDVFVELLTAAVESNREYPNSGINPETAKILLFLQQTGIGVVSEEVARDIKDNTVYTNLGGYEYGFQYNPGRAKRGGMFDVGMIGRMKETPLSGPFMGDFFPLQRGIPHSVRGGVHFMEYPNPYPHKDASMNAISKEFRIQKVTLQDLYARLINLTGNNPSGRSRFRDFMNLPFSGFSINHLHYQGFLDETNLERATEPEDALKTIAEVDGIKISRLSEEHFKDKPEFPSRTTFVVDGKNAYNMAQTVMQILELANEDGSTEITRKSRFTYNLLLVHKGGDNYRIYVMAKKVNVNPFDPTSLLEPPITVYTNEAKFASEVEELKGQMEEIVRQARELHPSLNEALAGGEAQAGKVKEIRSRLEALRADYTALIKKGFLAGLIIYSGNPAGVEMTDAIIFGHPDQEKAFRKVTQSVELQRHLIREVFTRVQYPDFENLVEQVQATVRAEARVKTGTEFRTETYRELLNREISRRAEVSALIVPPVGRALIYTAAAAAGVAAFFLIEPAVFLFLGTIAAFFFYQAERHIQRLTRSAIPVSLDDDNLTKPRAWLSGSADLNAALDDLILTKNDMTVAALDQIHLRILQMIAEAAPEGEQGYAEAYQGIAAKIFNDLFHPLGINIPGVRPDVSAIREYATIVKDTLFNRSEARSLSFAEQERALINDIKARAATPKDLDTATYIGNQVIGVRIPKDRPFFIPEADLRRLMQMRRDGGPTSEREAKSNPEQLRGLRLFANHGDDFLLLGFPEDGKIPLTSFQIDRAKFGRPLVKLKTGFLKPNEDLLVRSREWDFSAYVSRKQMKLLHVPGEGLFIHHEGESATSGTYLSAEDVSVLQLPQSVLVANLKVLETRFNEQGILSLIYFRWQDENVNRGLQFVLRTSVTPETLKENFVTLRYDILVDTHRVDSFTFTLKSSDLTALETGFDFGTDRGLPDLKRLIRRWFDAALRNRTLTSANQALTPLEQTWSQRATNAAAPEENIGARLLSILQRIASDFLMSVPGRRREDVRAVITALGNNLPPAGSSRSDNFPFALFSAVNFLAEVAVDFRRIEPLNAADILRDMRPRQPGQPDQAARLSLSLFTSEIEQALNDARRSPIFRQESGIDLPQDVRPAEPASGSNATLPPPPKSEAREVEQSVFDDFVGRFSSADEVLTKEDWTTVEHDFSLSQAFLLQLAVSANSRIQGAPANEELEARVATLIEIVGRKSGTSEARGKFRARLPDVFQQGYADLKAVASLLDDQQEALGEGRPRLEDLLEMFFTRLATLQQLAEAGVKGPYGSLADLLHDFTENIAIPLLAGKSAADLEFILDSPEGRNIKTFLDRIEEGKDSIRYDYPYSYSRLAGPLEAAKRTRATWQDLRVEESRAEFLKRLANPEAEITEQDWQRARELSMVQLLGIRIRLESARQSAGGKTQDKLSARSERFRGIISEKRVTSEARIAENVVPLEIRSLAVTGDANEILSALREDLLSNRVTTAVFNQIIRSLFDYEKRNHMEHLDALITVSKQPINLDLTGAGANIRSHLRANMNGARTDNPAIDRFQLIREDILIDGEPVPFYFIVALQSLEIPFRDRAETRRSVAEKVVEEIAIGKIDAEKFPASEVRQVTAEFGAEEFGKVIRQVAIEKGSRIKGGDSGTDVKRLAEEQAAVEFASQWFGSILTELGGTLALAFNTEPAENGNLTEALAKLGARQKLLALLSRNMGALSVNGVQTLSLRDLQDYHPLYQFKGASISNADRVSVIGGDGATALQNTNLFNVVSSGQSGELSTFKKIFSLAARSTIGAVTASKIKKTSDLHKDRGKVRRMVLETLFKQYPEAWDERAVTIDSKGRVIVNEGLLFEIAVKLASVRATSKAA